MFIKKYVKASRGDAQVGILWYTDESQAIDVSKPTDSGGLDGS